ncbi:hypothetical protein [Geminisphaera colitermitum]|uniref:hypothetical protein n=1 Tax=Geminisphaera colitermitum TaxID=1148786 RepID=UPI0001965004|nr:hypothetical protein [Geminisphaera colitermitum]
MQTDSNQRPWDEAFIRVESYLRALQIESRLQINRLAGEIIDTARARSRLDPDSDPVTLAMHVADERMERWFARVLGSAACATAPERIGIRGRLALVMANVPARWPQHFLADPDPASGPDTPLPPELVEAMRASYLEAGPELKLTTMTPRKIDLGRIATVADETWKTFRRLPFLRAATAWLVIITLLALAWIVTHP